MKINTKIRYGLRMLIAIAQSDKLVNTTELGKHMRVSPKYLRKLAGPARKSRADQERPGHLWRISS